MKKLLLFFAFLATFLAIAQQQLPSGSALSGTYLIGSGQPAPFDKLTTAIARINTDGVAGPVTFLLDNATYGQGEVFPIRIVQFPGTSTVNTFTIKPNRNRNVTITASKENDWTGVPAVLQMDGADNIIIDGSNTANGTSRNLNIVNNDNIGYTARTVVWISTNGTNAANNITVSNANLQMNSPNGGESLLAGIFCGSNSRNGNNALSGTVATAAISDINVKNNTFSNVRQGMIVKGGNAAELRSSNILFSSNTLGGGATDAQKNSTPILFSFVRNVTILDNSMIAIANTNSSDANLGIVIESSENTVIKRNILQDVKTSGTYNGRAIWIKGSTKTLEISENKISNAKNTVGGSIYGIHLDVTPESSQILLANNFISDVASSGSFGNTGMGIVAANGVGSRFYHNTVAMNSAQTGTSAAIYFSGGTSLDVRNNIFTNTGKTGTETFFGPYAIQVATGVTFSALNYNDYYATYIGRLGDAVSTTLAQWRTAAGGDANSLNILPVFTSAADLHLNAATNTALSKKGQVIAAVPTDIDVQIRSTNSSPNLGPDMGADEFSAVTVLAPTAQSTSLTFTNVTSNSFNIGWTKGTGTGLNSLVVIRSGSDVTSSPADGTGYTANAAFGTGSQMGTGNYVVYAGSGNSVSVTGLTSSTIYYVAVYEYNGTAATTKYLTANPLKGNRITSNLGWQISNTNTVNKINFDDTVSGVNNGMFTGAGFDPVTTLGQLNSNAWSLTGFEDGAILFGGINSNPDFGQGISTGGAAAGGIYAFETSANNRALGIQPGTNDFNPGTVTLRFQNQTSAPITSLSIGYKVYIYNDQATSSSFNFSHSADNTTFTGISQLNVVSPVQADVSPSWKSSYRVATITGLNIPAKGVYYLRWSGAAAAGSDYDEFALDDIVLSANPTNNFVAFEGRAQTFSVHGNTSLSGNVTVAEDLKLTAGKLSIGSHTLTLGGTVTNTIAGGLQGSSASNLSVMGSSNPTLSFDQTIPGTTNLLNDLRVPFDAPENEVLLSNPVVINGILNIGVDHTLNLGTTALTGVLSTITVNGNLRTQNTTALPVPAGKTFLGTGKVTYDATTAQTLVGGTYNHLTLNSPAGTTATGAVVVNGVLDLPQANPTGGLKGSLDMGSYVLTMGQDATNTGQGDVTGITTRNSILANVLYTFGNPNTSIIFPSVGTLPTSLSLKTVIGAAPSWRPGAIKRTFDFIQTGASGTKAIIKGHYVDSELNGNDEEKLVDWARINSTATTLEQGRSNYSTTDNWVELTNVNVGLYFTNSFDQVNLTLDESAAVYLTWNGSVSNSWTTADNWTPSATPSDQTAVFIPDAATTPNDPTLNLSTLIGSIQIDNGGILNAPANSQLTVNNGAGAWINNGTFNPGTGTSRVVFTNLDATIAGATDFNNVTINSNAGLRPLTDNIMRIAGSFMRLGNFTAAAIQNRVEYTGINQILAIPNGASSAYHDLIISGTGAVFPSSLQINGDFTVNGPVDFTGKTIVMGGLEPQRIGGTGNPQLNNLTVNNSDTGLALSSNIKVNGLLTLTAGRMNIGNFDLTLGSAAVAGTFGLNNMIVAEGSGVVRRPFTTTGSYLFPLGELTSTPAYSPITVDVTSGSFSNAFVEVSVADMKHPDNHSLTNYLSRYWSVKQTGITGAVATVTANFVAAEVLIPAEPMFAAQLNGTFSQQTNPWKRFSPVSNLTLTAAGAILEPAKTSYFTGIRGGAFTVVVLDGGTFCANETVTLASNVSGGDMAYTYEWSGGLGTSATAAPVETGTYTVTVKDANGITATGQTPVTINPAPIAGILSANQTVCFAFEPEAISLSGNTAPVLYWQRSDLPSFANPVTINNTTNTLTSREAGEIIGTTYFRAAVGNASCGTVFTETAVIDTRTTVWNGTSWTNGIPDIRTAAVISAGNYSLNTNLNACSLTITNGSNVYVPANFDLTLNGTLTVATGSTLTMESNTNLVQLSSEQNFGDIILKRNSAALYKLDYTMWGSPLYGSQKLKNFSPQTLSNRFYIYNPVTDLFNVVDPLVTGFTAGTGYLIRMPDNHIASGGTNLPQRWTGIFTGTPNNGSLNVPLTFGNEGFNLVSNPYASLMNADLFLAANTAEIDGTIYFWRRRNAVPDASAYYATYTTAGGTGVPTGAGIPSPTSDIPNGFIQVGQGFIVQKKSAGGSANLLFCNTMRSSANDADQFFRNTAAEERSRIWLNITNPAGVFGQTLIAYMSSASNGIDRSDGKYLGDGTTALTSWLDNSEYIIQGRAPFVSSDVVPLHFRTLTAGTYTIAIDHVDGIFSGSQDIYLRDRLLNINHNLKNAAYTFTSAAGSFDSRFEMAYNSDVLASDSTSGLESNSVVLYKKDKDIVVSSRKATLDHVEVFDMNGRLLAVAKNINSKEVSFNLGQANQVLIFRITSTEGVTISKKIIN